jgi:hypothetical protein
VTDRSRLDQWRFAVVLWIAPTLLALFALLGLAAVQC